MDTKVLTTFLKASELGSFSKVADELGYAPSTISVHIQQLEDELGYQLFDRIGKRIVLTQCGEAFISSARQVCIVLESAKSKYTAPEDMEGTLTIGILESLMSSELIPLLPTQYFSQYPKVNIIVKTATTRELFNQLRRNEVDIIFVLGERMEDEDCVRLYSRPESLMFVANGQHPLVNSYNVPLEQVLAEDLILTDKISVYRKILEKVAARRNIGLHPHVQSDNTKFIISMLLSGTGISFLPEYVARPYLTTGQLGVIHTDSAPIQCWSQAFYNKNKWSSPQMEGFIANLTGGKYPDYLGLKRDMISVNPLELELFLP